MTTLDQYRDKLRDAFPNGGGLSDDADLARLLETLGLTVEDPKPAPGLYLFGVGYHRGRPLLLDREGTIYYVNEHGESMTGAIHTPAEYATLIPARVVPAEPVELTEDVRGARGDAWIDYLNDYELVATDPTHEAFKAGYSAALAKYGHGTTTPSREDVGNAVRVGIMSQALGEKWEQIESVTHHVMALLEGGQA